MYVLTQYWPMANYQISTSAQNITYVDMREKQQRNKTRDKNSVTFS